MPLCVALFKRKRKKGFVFYGSNMDALKNFFYFDGSNMDALKRIFYFDGSNMDGLKIIFSALVGSIGAHLDFPALREQGFFEAPS
jgi:hypothetical protein